MGRLREDEIERMLAGGAAPTPPAYLTERIKSEIPRDVRIRRDALDRFPLTSFSAVYRQFMVMAAALGVLIGLTLFVMHTMKRIDDDKQRQMERLVELLDHDESAPSIVVPKAPVTETPVPQRRQTRAVSAVAAAGRSASATRSGSGESASAAGSERNRSVDDSSVRVAAAQPTPTPDVAIGATGGAGDDINVIGNDIMVPVLSERVEPEWGPAARATRRKGSVMVEVIVGKDGRVSDGRVLYDSAGLGCGEAVLEAVRRWKYRPATRSGSPVAVYVRITVAVNAR